jgi:predicted TPR repeat methyltransferase
VLVYFGALDELFTRVRGVLEPGGWFVFNVERHDGPGYRLRASGRYAHGEAYLREAAAEAGFAIAAIEPAVLRHDYGAPVNGLCVSLRAR